MSYSYQIKSFEQYHQDYKKSIEDPEGFGELLLKILSGKK